MSLLDFRKLSKLAGGSGEKPSWAIGLELDPPIPALPFESVLLYAVVYPSAKSAPSKDQIVNGLDVDNATAVWSGYAYAPTKTGTEVFDWPSVTTGLTASTSYRAAFVRVVNGNASNVVISDVWTTSGGGASGTSATTNANDTSSASGTTTIVGTLARTNANDTSSASGTTTVVGTSAKTNANDTSSASGTTTVTGTSATTNADDTSSASGTVGGGVSGTSATTNANDTSSASGTTTVVGSSATTNADDTGSASGTTTVVGTSATTNANDTASASGYAGAITGTSATTNADDSSSAVGSAGQSQTAFAGGLKKKKKYDHLDPEWVKGSIEQEEAEPQPVVEKPKKKAAKPAKGGALTDVKPVTLPPKQEEPKDEQKAPEPKAPTIQEIVEAAIKKAKAEFSAELEQSKRAEQEKAAFEAQIKEEEERQKAAIKAQQDALKAEEDEVLTLVENIENEQRKLLLMVYEQAIKLMKSGL